MKQITITIPDDCEVQIVKKEDKETKEDKKIRTYSDLIDSKTKARGYIINYISEIDYKCSHYSVINTNIAASKRVAKSMLAMAMISQLMPYYGGEITDEEWENISIMKYSFLTRNGKIIGFITAADKCFLAFHSLKQRDEFLKYNEQLVKDYLMID